MPQVEESASNSDASGQLPSAKDSPPPVDPEGFLFYVALGFVIAVSFYNSAFFEVLKMGIQGDVSNFVVIYMLGTLGGEAGFLAIAAVLGKGPLWLRMTLTLGVAICWIGAIFLNAPWSEENEVSELLRLLSLTLICLPLFFLIIQLPLWLCHVFLHWRIEPLSGEPQRRKPQLSIAGILSLTTAVAIAVGLVNLVPVVLADVVELDRTSLWVRFGGSMLMAFVVSLLTTVPLAALALRPRIGWVGAGFVALWFLLLTGVATSLEFTTTRFFSWQAPLRPAVQILGLVVATTSPLFLLRHWKYRLRWGRE
jgi:hypothetical protein